MASLGRLWPSPEYTRQVERLRAAVGETIYLVEIAVTDIQLGIRITGKPYVLLGLVDFPRPDPLKGLAPHLVLLDMHTGYGPRWQMSVVCSPLEAGEPAALARRFGYPRVVKAGGDAFYAMQGDMIDCAYRLAAQVPGRRIFAASFEFGTLGDSLLAGIRSLRATVWENQVRWHGAGPGMAAVVAREYGALFYPSDPAWRAKALADARRALERILQAEGLLGAGPGAAGVGP